MVKFISPHLELHIVEGGGEGMIRQGEIEVRNPTLVEILVIIFCLSPGETSSPLEEIVVIIFCQSLGETLSSYGGCSTKQDFESRLVPNGFFLILIPYLHIYGEFLMNKVLMSQTKFDVLFVVMHQAGFEVRLGTYPHLPLHFPKVANLDTLPLQICLSSIFFLGGLPWTDVWVQALPLTSHCKCS